MKTFFLIIALLITQRSFAQPVNITFYSEKHWVSGSGADQYAADKLATNFPANGNTAVVYISLEFNDLSAITAKDRLSLGVYKKTSGGDEYAFSQDMKIPQKQGSLKIKSNFAPGDYVARLVDKDNKSSVFGTATFSVGAASIPDYKHNCSFVACTSVNDNWDAIGETKSIKAGSCIQFLYKASKAQPPIMHYSMIWSFRRLKDDGSEEFVNDLNQMVEGGDKGWRYLSTENVCEFSKPGKYRVYLFDKETADAHHGTSDENYGMMEFSVK